VAHTTYLIAVICDVLSGRDDRSGWFSMQLMVMCVPALESTVRRLRVRIVGSLCGCQHYWTAGQQVPPVVHLASTLSSCWLLRDAWSKQ
jgi:uncharacterized membrane protein YccC